MAKIQPNIRRVGDLEIDQDLRFQHREWRLQRAAWAGMLLIVLAAIAGLFGGLGPLANGLASAEEDLLQVHYARFVRLQAPSTLRIQLDARAAAGSEVRLWIDRAYLSGLQIERIAPQPQRTQASQDRLLYTFEAERAGQPLEIVFDVTTEQVGLLRGRLGLPGGPSASFQQFVYP